MNYVVAGYVIVLSVLALYALGLTLRHRRLARLVSALEASGSQVAQGAQGTPLAGTEPGR